MRPLTKYLASLACCIYLTLNNSPKLEAARTKYPVPNGFLPKYEGFYMLNSIQTTISGNFRRSEEQVSEYLSLQKGLSFSLIEDRGTTRRKYAIISDGVEDRSYIVFNPEATSSSNNKVYCELDHFHTHKHVFPWQYTYKGSYPNDGSSKRRKNRRGKKRDGNLIDSSVYGVGAIWLNAITMNVTTENVNSRSPVENMNEWIMSKGDLTVKLDFERLNENDESITGENHRLHNIEIRREHSIKSSALDGNSVDDDIEQIVVNQFEKGIQSDDPRLDNFYYQLQECRRATQEHAAFPSLLKALNLSPERLYTIEYVARKYKLWGETTPSGVYDTEKHRRVYDTEYVNEWFSFKREIHVIIYEPLPVDFKRPLEADVFMSELTANAGQRSSRHAAVNYHFREIDGEPINCTTNESEPLPSGKQHLFARSVHFYRGDNNEIDLSSHIRGLGALLLNAAENHYKSFNLFTRTVDIRPDVHSLDRTETIEVNEWELVDHRSGWSYHFYFSKVDASESNYLMRDVTRLRLVEIRDTRVEINNMAYKDADLVARFDIMKFETNPSEDQVNFILTQPVICQDGRKPEPDDDHDSSDDHDHDSDDDDDWENTFWDADSDSDADDEYEHNHEHDQDMGETFELEPGKLIETNEIPDFYEFMKSSAGYQITSRISVTSNDSAAFKYIYLVESYISTNEIESLRIYTSQLRLDNDDCEMEYVINYHSELIFKILPGSKHCQLVDEVDPWLRLLSAELVYFVKAKSEANDNEVLYESTKVRQYGVASLWRLASESQVTNFIGMKRKPVVEDDGNEYKQVLWALSENYDDDFEYQFVFHFNETQHKEDKASKHHKHRDDYLQLKTITTNRFYTTDDDTHFRMMNLDVLHIKRTNKLSIKLHPCCKGAIEEADRIARLHDSELFKEASLPSFFDLVAKSSSGYKLKYTTLKSTYGEFETDITTQKTSIYSIEEEYNHAAHRGRIGVIGKTGGNQYFIETLNKLVYNYKDQYTQCTKATEIKPLFDLGSTLDLDNRNFDESKLFGLSGLWIALEKIKNYHLEVTNKLDRYGNKQRRFIYTATLKGDRRCHDMGVEITFVRELKSERAGDSTSPVKLLYHDDLRLTKIEIAPANLVSWVKENTGTKLSKLVVLVDKISESAGWEIPKQCLESSNSGEGGDSTDPSAQPVPVSPIGEAKFPRFTSIIEFKNFHMRSEVVISSGSTTYLYLLDEWIMGDKIRMKSHRLKSDFDLLLLRDGAEVFDISVPYKCSKTPPTFSFMSQQGGGWKPDSADIESLSWLYYGPLSLWILASRGELDKKLINAVDIAPQPTGKKNLDEMELELRTEIWRVSSPEAVKLRWSYDMKFEKMSLDTGNGTKREWHVLDSIEIFDKDSRGSSFTIEVDVVNYRYNHTERETQELFRLPDGYGCVRDENVAGTTDELVSNIQQFGGRIYYEASLELLESINNDDAQLGPINVRKQVLPALSGTLIKTGQDLSSIMSIFAHHSRTRLLDGNFQASKKVYDASNSLLYQIDNVTGYCTIGLVLDADWSLDFPYGNRSMSVIVDGEMNQLLFLNTYKQKFGLVNYYQVNGVTVTTYEHRVENLRLSSTLSGPASIIRYYTTVDRGMPHYIAEENRYVTFHDNVAVRVLLFNSLRTQVLAAFSMSVHIQEDNPTSGLDRLLQGVNVAQCFNDGDQEWNRASESFVIEYQIEPRLHFVAMLVQNQLKTTVYKSLINYAQVSPLQLDGHIRIEASGNSLLRVHFNLMQAPTAYLYFRERVDCKMTDAMELKSELRFVSSVTECSKWCDKVGCLAMSYCLDRTCTILPDRYFGKRHADLTKNQLTELASCVSHGDCSYYYRLGPQPLSLDRFEELMTKTINMERDSEKLAQLTIDVSYTQILPAQFYSSRKKFETLDEDIDNPKTPAQNRMTYHIARRDFRLDAAHLDDFNSAESSQVIAYHLPHPSYAECLEECKLTNDDGCVAASFCKANSECTILAGKTDVKRLVNKLGSNSTGCSVTVRDYTPEFERIHSVSVPTTYETKLEHYSTIECASACKAAGDACLSFDSCRPQISAQDEKLDDDGEDTATKLASICYLQRSHITQDSFNRSRVQLNGGEKLPELSCDHYSRAAINDYWKLANKKLLNKMNAVVRGLSADRCAVDCEQDEECRAFEYCYNIKHEPAQSCYFVRSSDILDTSNDKEIAKQLKDSKSCSVYVLQAEMAKPMAGLPNIGSNISFFRKLLTVLVYIFGSILAGAIFQSAFIRIMGRPLFFSR